MGQDSSIRQAELGVRQIPHIVRGIALPVGFTIIAIGLLSSPKRAEIPSAAPVVFDRAALVVAPRRTAMTDPPQMLVEGSMENCNACHQIFQSAHGAGETLSYHADVRLNHGLNARCSNCHDAENREQLTLRDGTAVPYVQTPLLCAQCHGTVYRDWQNGTHGKTLGSWVTGAATQRRLNCNECHDPHSPRYAPYEPLPGPRTLRMGDPPSAAHHPPAKPSPLQRWLSPSSMPHRSEAHDAGELP